MWGTALLEKSRHSFVRRAKQASLAIAVAVTLLPGTGKSQMSEQSPGPALNVPQSQQELDLPPPSTTARPRPKSRPQRARSENLGLSRNLATFLHNHRLPYVDAHVFEDADSSQVVILSGFVATQFGRDDATEKAHQFLAESAPEVTNQIVIDPTVRLRPPAQFVSQGDLGEILPRTFRGCWQGTVYTLDSIHVIPPFQKMGPWMSETYRLCYLQRGNDAFELTFTSVTMDPTAVTVQGYLVDDMGGHAEVVSTDGHANAKLRAFIHFKDKSPGLFGLFSHEETIEETVDLVCTVLNGEMNVQAQFEEHANEMPFVAGSWHQTFRGSVD
jgi:hypothetical protein